MDIEYLESLPDETICRIVSNITDEYTITLLLTLSSRIRNIAKDCIINFNGDYTPARIVSQFKNLVRAYNISVGNPGDVIAIASLPKLKNAWLLNQITGDLDENYVSNFALFFINTYAYSQYAERNIVKSFDDTYFILDRENYNSKNYFNNSVIIKGNQYRDKNANTGISLHFSKNATILNDQLDTEMANVILALYNIQQTNNSYIDNIYLDFDTVNDYALGVINSISGQGKMKGIGINTVYNIWVRDNTDLFERMLRIVRKLRVFSDVNKQNSEGLNLHDMIELSIYKNLEYLDGPFNPQTFLEDNYVKVFPNLNTIGFYVANLDNLSFIDELHPNIQNVILYVPFDDTSQLVIESSKSVTVLPVTMLDSDSFVYPYEDL